jgi:hypothetical protein
MDSLPQPKQADEPVTGNAPTEAPDTRQTAVERLKAQYPNLSEAQIARILN